MGKQNVVCIYTHTQWNVIQPSKGKTADICYNMDETSGHYAKWIKPVRKRQIQYCMIPLM